MGKDRRERSCAELQVIAVALAGMWLVLAVEFAISIGWLPWE